MKISNILCKNKPNLSNFINKSSLVCFIFFSLMLSGCGGQGTNLSPETSIVQQPGQDGYPLVSPEVKRLYGPGVFRLDALGNTMIGVNGRLEQIVSNRFRASHSGHLSRAHLYWQPGPGYSRGNGGRIRLRLMPDNGHTSHEPDMTAVPLATAEYTPGAAALDKHPIFADAHFSSQRPMQSGQLYHLVMDNIDVTPALNSISSNNAITQQDNDRPSRWVSPTDWATLTGTRPAAGTASFAWTDLSRHPAGGNYYAPILQLTTTDGQTQGMSIMESGSVDPDRIFTLRHDHPVRERFQPLTSRQITGLSFATATSTGGTLIWRILHGTTELASGRISESTPNYRTLLTRADSARTGKIFWYDALVGAPGQGVALQAGQTYDVEFQPEGQSEWKFADHYNGSQHGFTAPAAFTESHAQHQVAGRWINANHWSHLMAGSTESNWPIVLHQAP